MTMVAGVGMHSHADRGHDFYATPPEAVHSLIAIERKWFPDCRVIWEPACGDGAISKVLESYHYDVVSTDLVDRGYGEGGRDFLTCASLVNSAIITNPPFKLAREFIDTALEHAPYVAMLEAFLVGGRFAPEMLMHPAPAASCAA